MDPLRDSPWNAPEMVAGFANSAPNETLMAFAAQRLAGGRRVAIDIGCGAGRNLIPLARQGWTAAGVDLSSAMLERAAARIREETVAHRASVALAAMDALPFANQSADLVVAHGVWNLARSSTEFRRAAREAARISRDGAALFVFTFSRHTVPPDAAPVPGEAFVFTEFSGHRQCFLTQDQLVSELANAGFERDASVPLTELNVPRPGTIVMARAPVIWEAVFRRSVASGRERPDRSDRRR
jgi:SAM-dependent methyltransferase